MPLPAWPETVPTGTRDGWQVSQMFLPALATEMEGGNQRLRSRPGDNVASITYPLQPLTEAQWADLETFLRVTLNNGASRFTMPLLTGATTVTKTVQLEGGKSPTVTRSGGFMNVTLTLRVYGM
jgi:hypothetical protein